ncbi:hypothetical protein [uncultured Draconibacterium sp.]|uniref:hypothetical protein n=1 Tax=uncultured Draconibacterium sp. TaxID=1573823 RepID=UPI0025E0280A|nr:hypothetical protein [uncultured Draconibacterium sp.]
MKLNTLILLLLLVNIANAQVKKEYLNYDYFNHSYQYLNKDYSITIQDSVFQRFVKEFKFIPERIKSYNDSLSVILCGEFGNWDQVRIAKHRITFSWQRLGYILWMSAEESEEFGRHQSFIHPYSLYKHIIYQEDKWSSDTKRLIRNLRDEVAAVTNIQEIDKLETKELLKLSLIHSPDRIKDYAKFKSENSQCTGKGCGREDCCK